MEGTIKKCCKCKVEKPLSSFHKRSHTKDGLDFRCKSCRKIERSIYRKTETYLDNTRRYNQSEHGRVSRRKTIKKYRETHLSRTKARDRKNRLKHVFGLTLDQYDKILENQNGVCAICGKPERAKMYGVIRRLAVDHDHKTGKIRGLLCALCNQAIGLLNDDINNLASAIKYLS
jgi:hypothetical protein